MKKLLVTGLFSFCVFLPFVSCSRKAAEANPGQIASLSSRSAEDLFAEAKKLYDQKDYDRAAPLMMAAAEKGNAEAQMHLGKMYYNGRGVPHDHEKAIYWHKKAAEQGNQESIEKLKTMSH